MNALLKSSSAQLPTRPASMDSSNNNFQTSIENFEMGRKTNDQRKVDANNRYGNAPFRLQDKHSEFLRTLTDIEGAENSFLLKLPTAPASPDSESTNLAVENSLSLETSLVTDAIAQADMSGLKTQDPIRMGTAQLTKGALVQASSEDDLPAKAALTPPPITQSTIQYPAATTDAVAIETSTLLLNDLQKDVEGEENSFLLKLPTAPASPDSESTNLAVENSLSLETALVTDAIAQADMSGLKTQDPIRMGTAQLTKGALVQASSEDDLPAKAALTPPPITQSTIQYPAATTDAVAIETSTLLLNDLQKVVPEGTPHLGLSNQASSAAAAKTFSTQVSIAQSSIEHPAVQTVARTLAQVQETQSGISVRLNPPEMGRVFIDFQFNADRSVTAIIRSEVPETAVLLKHNADFLQDALKDSGFNSVTLSFEQNDRSKHEGFNFDQKEGSPMLYQSTPSDGEDQSDTSETIHRHQTSTNSAIDLKL